MKSMTIIFFCSFLMLLAVSPAGKDDPKNDPELVGTWRSAAPVGPEDAPEVFEFRLDKKGKAMMFHVKYGWNEDSQTWEPSTADQPAQGDNDEWETENGFMTIRIRERYVKNRDLVVRYRIEDEMLHLQMAEIYRRQSKDGPGIWGEWRMETYDQFQYEEKRIRQFLLSEGGIMREKVDGQAYSGKIFLAEGGWQQLRSTRLGDGSSRTDTVYQPYLLQEDNLYLYQDAPWVSLKRRK